MVANRTDPFTSLRHVCCPTTAPARSLGAEKSRRTGKENLSTDLLLRDNKRMLYMVRRTMVCAIAATVLAAVSRAATRALAGWDVRCGEVVVVTVLMVRRRDGAWPGSTDAGGTKPFRRCGR